MMVLHATEPATPYLSVFARVNSFTRADMECALFETRSVIRQLAMRRTLFVFPRDLLSAALSAPSERVARQDFGKLVKDVEAGGISDDGVARLDAARTAVRQALVGKREFGAKDLRESLPQLSGQISWYQHKPYGNVQHIAPRVLAWMGATGDLVRGHHDSHWRVSRTLWARMDDWLEENVAHVGVRGGYARLTDGYLRAFGPVTETDLVWWFGAPKSVIHQSLTDLKAVKVRLERSQVGWVLPDDVDPEPPVEPWAAVLPALDPTALGWKERDFYLAPDFYPAIFDWSGNCGTTAGWNGQIVGAYVQNNVGRVELTLGRDPGAAGRAALRAEAKRLENWLDGEKVNAAYKSPLVTQNHPDRLTEQISESCSQ